MTQLSTNPQELSTPQGYSREQIDLLKRTYAKGSTDDEFQLFLHVSKRSGLDPFSRQIYAIKRWDNREKREIMTPQTSIDGYRLIAARTQHYVPGKKPTYEYNSDGSLKSATAYIKILAGGEWHDVEAEAFWDEYVVTYEKDGKKKLGPMWDRMPHVMLAKCAEALVIRKSFPNETAGIYTSEEMGRANAETPIPPPRTAAPVTEDEEPYDPSTGEVLEPVPIAPPPLPSPQGALSPKQQAFLFGLAKKKGWDENDVKAYSAKFYSKDDPTKLTSKELDKILQQLKTLPDAPANQ